MRRLALLLAFLATFTLIACEPEADTGGTGQAAKPAPPTATAPAATPLPPPSPTATPAAEAVLVTAQAWYPLAEQQALAWQPDAVLSAVTGASRNVNGDALPPDGRSDRWHYTFISATARQQLEFSITDSQVSSQRTVGLTLMGQPVQDKQMVWYTDLIPGGEWAIDSDQAVAIALPLHQAKHGAPPEALSYVLFNGKDADVKANTLVTAMRWVINGDPEGPSFQVVLDARTGEVRRGP